MARQSNPSTVRPWRWLLVFGLIGLPVVALIVFQPWLSNAQGVRQKPKGDEFASDRKDGNKGDEKPIAIDGKRAMEYLESVCKIGPRISGTEGMKKQQELIEKHFKDLDATVTYQKFDARQKSVRKAVSMANMVISYHPDRKRRVILCSHYDTRPIADQEDDRRMWKKPFVSANDGGSGVALLMELGHHMKKIETEVGVDFVLFDGEEYVFDQDDTYFFGSKQFAKEYTSTRKKSKITYTAAILLDMIAGKGAKFPIEQNSWLKQSKLVREVWNIAGELKITRFKSEFSRVPVEDDHIPLNAGNIPAIDIIDFDYRHWHLLSDVPKNCSPEPMEDVAKVLSVWLQRQK
jgi:glutaminyl-peptide cyclotransferase